MSAVPPIGFSSTTGFPCPTSQSSLMPMFSSIEGAINWLLENKETCSEEFLIENFNIVCSSSLSKKEMDPLNMNPCSLEKTINFIEALCSWNCGGKLFVEMVQALRDKQTVVVFCSSENNPGLEPNLLKSSDFLLEEISKKYTDKNFLLFVRLNPDEKLDRCCAFMDGSGKIYVREISLRKAPVKGCNFGHEDFHLCSFLRKLKPEELHNTGDDIAEKIAARHRTEKGQSYPLVVLPSFQRLFTNGEEMRNLCGLSFDEEGKICHAIGEFSFWQEAEGEGHLIIPLYCKVAVLSPEDEAMLHQLFRIKFSHCPPCKTVPAEMVLGIDFSGFKLVDIPIGNDQPILAALVASGGMVPRFQNPEGFLILSPEQQEQIGRFRQLMSTCVPLLHEHSMEISDALQIFSNRLNIDHFPFIARALGRPIILVQPAMVYDESAIEASKSYSMTCFAPDGHDGRNVTESAERISEQVPGSVFIYFNGVNHFQALLPKTEEEIQAEEEQRKAKIAKMAKKDEEKNKPLDQKKGGCTIS